MASGSGDQLGLVVGAGRRPVKQGSGSGVSDALLVGNARNGDRVAFGHLYDRYAPMVHGVLLAKVPLGEVDDLVQDVFVLALRRLSTLREPGSFAAWLAAIARNAASDYYRRSVPEHPLTAEAELADGTAENEIGSGNKTDRESDAATVLDIIRGLPEAYRETLILRLVEGMTGPEIAARTGLTHGSVRVNLHRGMQQLRAKLSPISCEDRSEQEKQ